MQAALDDSIAYAKKRVQFQRKIGSFQLVQAMIADMIVDTETSRFLAYRAAELMDNGIRCEMEQSMAKVHAAQAAVRVTDKAIQIHGALGLTRYEGYHTERYFRDARLCGIGEGTTEILKLVVARKALGIQAFV
jgi:alkylation response protein AidB-like acyl-CoA dehydrogenase